MTMVGESCRDREAGMPSLAVTVAWHSLAFASYLEKLRDDHWRLRRPGPSHRHAELDDVGTFFRGDTMIEHDYSYGTGMGNMSLLASRCLALEIPRSPSCTSVRAYEQKSKLVSDAIINLILTLVKTQRSSVPAILAMRPLVTLTHHSSFTDSLLDRR